ncbi:MAG: hypothetical protein RLZZ628_3642 [Bacteroidota bacterium]|jgi:hypothetical protein
MSEICRVNAVNGLDWEASIQGIEPPETYDNQWLKL